MRKGILGLAVAAALMAPALAMPGNVDLGRRDPNTGWKPRGLGGSRRNARQRRDPGALMRSSFAEIPCEAPEGYFWKRQPAGRQRWRLYKHR